MATTKAKPETKAPAAKPAKSRVTASRSSKTKTSKSFTTTNHDEIRAWVEQRKGTPSTVKGTDADESKTGILRIDFPGYSGKDSLEAIGWDDFFKNLMRAILNFYTRKKQLAVNKAGLVNSFQKNKMLVQIKQNG